MLDSFDLLTLKPKALTSEEFIVPKIAQKRAFTRKLEEN